MENERNDQEIREVIKDYEKRILAASDQAEKKRLTAEAMQYITEAGVTVPVESLETTARFAANVVDGVLYSIIRTAKEMGTESVPIGFIEQLRPLMPEYINKSLMTAATEVGVPIGFGDGVPDDLSGLEL